MNINSILPANSKQRFSAVNSQYNQKKLSQPSVSDAFVRFSGSDSLKPREGFEEGREEATRILEEIIPRLSEATDWNIKRHYNREQPLDSGMEMSCVLDGKKYSLRDILIDDGKSYPDMPEGGFYLVVEENGKESIYHMVDNRPDYDDGDEAFNRYYDQQKDFYSAYSAFGNFVYPQFSELAIDNILNNLDSFESEKVVIADNHGMMGFFINGRYYYMDWGMGNKSHPTLAEAPDYSEADLAREYILYKDQVTEINQARAEKGGPGMSPFEIKNYDDFVDQLKTDYKRYTTYKIADEQLNRLLKELTQSFGKVMSDCYNLGEDLEPMPFFYDVARRLIANPKDGQVRYRKHDDNDEITLDTSRGNQDINSTPEGIMPKSREKGPDDYYIEITRYDRRDDHETTNKISDCYMLRTRERGNDLPYLSMKIDNPEQIAFLDKMMTIIKLLDERNGGDWGAMLGALAKDQFTGTNELDQFKKAPEDFQKAAQLLDELEQLLPENQPKTE